MQLQSMFFLVIFIVVQNVKIFTSLPFATVPGYTLIYSFINHFILNFKSASTNFIKV